MANLDPNVPQARWRGYNPPFMPTLNPSVTGKTIGNQSNILSRQEGIRLIKNDLLQLLMTTPGSRYMRPDFGTNLKSSLFEPLDQQLLSSIKSSISTAIAKFEQRVTVTVNVTADVSDSTGHTIKVDIVGYENSTSEKIRINLALPSQS